MNLYAANKNYYLSELSRNLSVSTQAPQSNPVSEFLHQSKSFSTVLFPFSQVDLATNSPPLDLQDKTTKKIRHNRDNYTEVPQKLGRPSYGKPKPNSCFLNGYHDTEPSGFYQPNKDSVKKQLLSKPTTIEKKNENGWALPLAPLVNVGFEQKKKSGWTHSSPAQNPLDFQRLFNLFKSMELQNFEKSYCQLRQELDITYTNEVFKQEIWNQSQLSCPVVRDQALLSLNQAKLSKPNSGWKKGIENNQNDLTVWDKFTDNNFLYQLNNINYFGENLSCGVNSTENQEEEDQFESTSLVEIKESTDSDSEKDVFYPIVPLDHNDSENQILNGSNDKKDKNTKKSLPRCPKKVDRSLAELLIENKKNLEPRRKNKWQLLAEKKEEDSTTLSQFRYNSINRRKIGKNQYKIQEKHEEAIKNNSNMDSSCSSSITITNNLLSLGYENPNQDFLLITKEAKETRVGDNYQARIPELGDITARSMAKRAPQEIWNPEGISREELKGYFNFLSQSFNCETINQERALKLLKRKGYSREKVQTNINKNEKFYSTFLVVMGNSSLDKIEVQEATP